MLANFQTDCCEKNVEALGEKVSVHQISKLLIFNRVANEDICHLFSPKQDCVFIEHHVSASAGNDDCEFQFQIVQMRT